MEEGKTALKILTGKPTGRGPLRRPSRWEDNFRMDLDSAQENWVNSAQDRDYWRALANATLKLQAS